MVVDKGGGKGDVKVIEGVNCENQLWTKAL